MSDLCKHFGEFSHSSFNDQRVSGEHKRRSVRRDGSGEFPLMTGLKIVVTNQNTQTRGIFTLTVVHEKNTDRRKQLS